MTTVREELAKHLTQSQMSSFFIDKMGLINVKSYGAKGDGITNDLTSIRNTISAAAVAGGGVIYFPTGTYRIDWEAGGTGWNGGILTFASNMTFVFDGGAKIVSYGYADHNSYRAIFGPDLTTFPIENVKFLGMALENVATSQANFEALVTPRGIELITNADSPANSIENVVVDKCRFVNVASPVYIVNRLQATTDRQAKGIKITNCYAEGCLASFATVDGEDLLVHGNTAIGYASNPTIAYDAVSCHCGKNVKVIGNTFSDFKAGQCINIRHSADTSLNGSDNVIVMGNSIRNVREGILISALVGETTYGVKNVVVTGNIIDTADYGISVTPGNASAGTPFNNFTIQGNLLKHIAIKGLNFHANEGVFIADANVQGNSVEVTAVNTGYGLYGAYLQRAVIKNNRIRCTANSGGTFEAFSLNNIYYSQIAGNWVWSSDVANAGKIKFDALYYSDVVDNYFRGQFNFVTTIDYCYIDRNNFQENGTFKGIPLSYRRNFTLYPTNRKTVYDDSLPTAGTWGVGDLVLKLTPVAGDYIGWTCTTAGTFGGTPPVFKTYGPITA